MIRFFVSNFLFFCLSIGVGFADTPVPCDCERTVGVYALSHTVEDFESLILPWLSSSLSGGCVKVVPLSQVEKPEYVLSVHYEQDEKGRLPSAGNPDSIANPIFDNGRIKSMMSFELFYTMGLKNHSNETFWNSPIGVILFRGGRVGSFTTRTVNMSLDEHKRRMLEQNPILKKLSVNLEKYEQIPKSVSVDAEKTEMLPGEIIKLKLKDLKDKWGDSIEGNVLLRFQVEVKKGRIQSELGPLVFMKKKFNYYFQQEFGVNHPYVLLYQAPVPKGGCYEDMEETLTVHNSCNILTKFVSPLEETKYCDEIGRLRLKIKCPRGRVTVRRVEHTVWTDQAKFEDSNGKLMGFRKKEFRDEKLASFTGRLRLTASMPKNGQFWDMYMVENPRKLNTHFNYHKVFHSENYGSLPGKLSTVDESRIGLPTSLTLNPPAGMPLIVMYKTAKRKKVLNVGLPGYTASLMWSFTDRLYTVLNGEVTTDYNKNHTSGEQYTIERKGFKGTLMTNATVGQNSIVGRDQVYETIDEATPDNGRKTGIRFKEFDWNLFLNKP